MYKGKKILALVPARGGSKGLKRKNIYPLNGKPLITWSIEQAVDSTYLDRIVVSTEDSEIADVSRKAGADVPFSRPDSLATDRAASIDVILHAIDFLGDRGMAFDYLMLLEPTSPLRETADIDRCIEKLVDNEAATAIVSVARLECGHPEFNVVIDGKTGFIRKMLDGTAEFNILRRQDIKDVFFFDGTIYLSEVESLRKTRTFYHDRTLPYVVPRWKAVEIDELQDAVIAEALMKARAQGRIE